MVVEQILLDQNGKAISQVSRSKRRVLDKLRNRRAALGKQRNQDSLVGDDRVSPAIPRKSRFFSKGGCQTGKVSYRGQFAVEVVD